MEARKWYEMSADWEKCVMAGRAFHENRQTEYAPRSAPRSVAYANLKIDTAGRIIVPAEMRAAMMAKPGDSLTAHVVDGELRVVSRAWVMRRVEEEAERFKAANPVASFANELAANRQEEVRLDEERWSRLEAEAAATQHGTVRR